MEAFKLGYQVTDDPSAGGAWVDIFVQFAGDQTIAVASRVVNPRNGQSLDSAARREIIKAFEKVFTL